MENSELIHEESIITLNEIQRLNFSDEVAAENFTEILASPAFNRIWIGEDGPLPFPETRLDWDEFDDYYALSQKDLVHALKDWLLE